MEKVFQYIGFNEGVSVRRFDHNGDRIPVQVVVVDGGTPTTSKAPRRTLDPACDYKKHRK